VRARARRCARASSRGSPRTTPSPIRRRPRCPTSVLRLIFTCCHPALAPEARVALTLRALGGLTTAAVARSFLVPEATMAKRLERAKHKIRDAAIPFRVPPPDEWSARVASVLAVVYLIFNAGYSATGATADERRALVRRGDPAGAVCSRRSCPRESEVHGLCALMLLHDARRDARTGDDGALVPLDAQDRSLWRGELVGERRRRARARRRLRPARAVSDPGRDLGGARVRSGRFADAVARDRGAVRRARSAAADAGRADQPRSRGGSCPGRRSGGSHCSRRSPRTRAPARSSRPISPITQRAPTCSRARGRSDEARAAYERAIALCRDESERRFLERRRGSIGAR